MVKLKDGCYDAKVIKNYICKDCYTWPNAVKAANGKKVAKLDKDSEWANVPLNKNEEITIIVDKSLPYVTFSNKVDYYHPITWNNLYKYFEIDLNSYVPPLW